MTMLKFLIVGFEDERVKQLKKLLRIHPQASVTTVLEDNVSFILTEKQEVQRWSQLAMERGLAAQVITATELMSVLKSAFSEEAMIGTDSESWDEQQSEYIDRDECYTKIGDHTKLKFENSQICIMGYEAIEQDALKNAVSLLGGESSISFDSRTSMVIANENCVVEIRALLKEYNLNIPLLQEEVIWECLSLEVPKPNASSGAWSWKLTGGAKLPPPPLIACRRERELFKFNIVSPSEIPFALDAFTLAGNSLMAASASIMSQNSSPKSPVPPSGILLSLREEAESYSSSENRIPKNKEEKDRRKLWKNTMKAALQGGALVSKKNIMAATKSNKLLTQYNHDLWIGARAFLSGRRLADEEWYIQQERKAKTDAYINAIKGFCSNVKERANEEDTVALVLGVLQLEDELSSLFPSYQQMLQYEPRLGEAEVEERQHTLSTWENLRQRFLHLTTVLNNWTGTGCGQTPWSERLLQDMELLNLFEKTVLNTLKKLLEDSTAALTTMLPMMKQMNLINFTTFPETLSSFYLRLMKQILQRHTADSQLLTAGSSFFVMRQMLENLEQALGNSTLAKKETLAMYRRLPHLKFDDRVLEGFEEAQVEALNAYFRILQLKLERLMQSDSTNVNLLETRWRYIKTIAVHIHNGPVLAACKYSGLIRDVLKFYYVRNEAKVSQCSKDKATFKRRVEFFSTSIQKVSNLVKSHAWELANAAEYSFQADTNLLLERLMEKCFVKIKFKRAQKYSLQVFAHESFSLDAVEECLSSCLSLLDQPEQGEQPFASYIVVISGGMTTGGIGWRGPEVKSKVKLSACLQFPVSRIRIISKKPAWLSACRADFEELQLPITLIHPWTASLSFVADRLKRVQTTIGACLIRLPSLLSGIAGHSASEEFVTAMAYLHFAYFAKEAFEFSPSEQGEEALLNISIDWLGILSSPKLLTLDERVIEWTATCLEFTLYATSLPFAFKMTRFGLLQARVSEALQRIVISSSYSVSTAAATAAGRTVSQIFRRFPNSDTPAAASMARLQRILILENRLVQQEEEGMIGRVIPPEDVAVKYLTAAKSSVVFKWQKIKFVGKGASGAVYLCLNLESGDIVAMKEIKFSNPGEIDAERVQMLTTIKVMEKVHHPNIVSYYGFELRRDRIHLFMEYCSGGSLTDLLHSGAIGDEAWIQRWVKQIVEGLVYIHSLDIQHLDLKPDNLLLDEKGVIKLVDFGTARLAASTTAQADTVLQGTPMYMAPELVMGGSKGRVGAQDVWSLGCCVLEMFTGKRPWSHLDNQWAIMYHLATDHPPFPTDQEIPPLAVEFMLLCFVHAAPERATAEQLLQHPWLTTFISPSVGEESS